MATFLMSIDWVELSRVVPYIGVAVLFAAFVIWLLENQNKRDKMSEEMRMAREAAREKIRQEEKTRLEAARAVDIERQDRKDAERDKRFLDAIADRDARFIQSFSAAAKEWQDGLRRDRGAMAEATAGLAKELERLSTLVRLTNLQMERHDQWERAIWDVQRLKQGGDADPPPFPPLNPP